MLALVIALTLGQVEFSPNPLSAIQIGNVTPFTGRATTNYVHGDVDGDGDLDLLLANQVFLQDEGRYVEGSGVLLPAPKHDVEIQFYGGLLYYRDPDGLTTYAFSNGAWTSVLQQSLDWPGKEGIFDVLGRSQPELRFRRFLHDLDGDTIPELIVVEHRGIHIFRCVDARYIPAGTMNLPASIVTHPPGSQPIWPESRRSLLFPEQQLSARLVFDEDMLRVVSIRERRENETHYAVQSTILKEDSTGTFQVQTVFDGVLEPLPAHLRPCRLNDDNTIDFAGGRWLRSEASALPTSLYELWATLDGGKTYHVRRASAYIQFRPHCSFVDFDGDGDMDMITESTQWPRGSIREQLNRFLTDSRLYHDIQVYLQSDREFSDTPDITHHATVTLEAPPVKPGAMLDRYRSGSLVDLTGDMNGDGFRDLLLRAGPESLELYLARDAEGFMSEPAWSLSVASDASAHVADINGDGLSDIYLEGNSQDSKGRITATGVAYYASGRQR